MSNIKIIKTCHECNNVLVKISPSVLICDTCNLECFHLNNKMFYIDYFVCKKEKMPHNSLFCITFDLVNKLILANYSILTNIPYCDPSKKNAEKLLNLIKNTQMLK